eukprot:5974587-Alexandrium_andersonii.AAC.1
MEGLGRAISCTLRFENLQLAPRKGNPLPERKLLSETHSPTKILTPARHPDSGLGMNSSEPPPPGKSQAPA